MIENVKISITKDVDSDTDAQNYFANDRSDRSSRMIGRPIILDDRSLSHNALKNKESSFFPFYSRNPTA